MSGIFEFEAKDLTLQTPHGMFNHRVGAFVVCGNEILMQKSSFGFYFPVGGRIQFGENSVDALKREIKEELNIEVEDFEFAVYAENFFHERGQDFHEVSPYYRISLEEKFTPPTQDVNGKPLVFEWLKIKELPQLNVMPPFLGTQPHIITQGFHHIIQK